MNINKNKNKCGLEMELRIENLDKVKVSESEKAEALRIVADQIEDGIVSGQFESGGERYGWDILKH